MYSKRFLLPGVICVVIEWGCVFSSASLMCLLLVFFPPDFSWEFASLFYSSPFFSFLFFPFRYFCFPNRFRY